MSTKEAKNKTVDDRSAALVEAPQNTERAKATRLTRSVPIGSLLLAHRGTRRAVAAELGVSGPTVQEVIDGSRPASPKLRAKCEELFRWPPEVWSAVVADGAIVVAVEPGPIDTLALLREQVGRAEALARNANLTPQERLKAETLLRQAVDAFREATGESTSWPESRLVKTPGFRRAVNAVIDALRPWPEAVKAMAIAMGRLENQAPAEETGQANGD